MTKGLASLLLVLIFEPYAISAYKMNLKRSLVLAGGASDLKNENKLSACAECGDLRRRRGSRELNAFVWSEQGSAITGTVVGSQGDLAGEDVEISADGGVVVVGAPRDFTSAPAAGSARVFGFDNGNWMQRGQTLLGDGPSDEFGHSVAVSMNGSIIAVGAPQLVSSNDQNPGYVRVFEYSSSTTQWSQLGADIRGVEIRDLCGDSLSLSSDGRIIAIGSPGNQGNSLLLRLPGGQVRVFSFDDTASSWSQVGDDIEGEAGFTIGRAVDLSADGTIVALGGLTPDSIRMRTYEFNSGSSSWDRREPDIDTPFLVNVFFFEVALSSANGDIVAISDPNRINNDNPAIPPSQRGRVRVFQYTNTSAASATWTQLGQDLLGEIDGNQFGTAIALSSDGGTLAVGIREPDDSGALGQVRIFQFDSGADSWQRISQDIRGSRRFSAAGTAVSLSSDGSQVAFGEPTPITQPGLVRVFVNSNQPLPPTPPPTFAPTIMPPPTPAPPKFFCFPGDATVDVQGSGITPLRELKLGDAVLVDEGKYETVYSFGHKLSDTRHSDYIQLSVGNEKLVLTPDHMVFVGRRGRSIPASLIEVGEELQTAQQGRFATVEEVNVVAATGLYAPFTPSGKLIVNSVRVSSFTSLQGTEMIEAFGFSTGITHQWFNSILALPHRFLCNDLGVCGTETYIDGVSAWMQVPMALYKWWYHQRTSVQGIILIPFALGFMALVAVDAVFRYTVVSLAFFVFVTVSFAVYQRKRSGSSDADVLKLRTFYSYRL